MRWTKSADELSWIRACGRYTVSRSLSFDRNPAGEWVYLAHFRRYDMDCGEWTSDVVSPERRYSFEDAVKDAGAHIRS
jgi:hypothetical protein